MVAWRFFHDQLGANPIREAEIQTGLWTLRSLAVTLSITPARRLTGWNGLIKFRRMLGLFTFFYACVHLSLWVGVDWFFDWAAMGKEIAKHKYILIGMLTFLLLLPLALPGIITGMALSSFYTWAGVRFSIWTIVIGHATFCVVVVYNNVLARLRRTSPSIVEASMDLGADGWQTFRFVVWPVLSTALIAGGLLAFALSFDEVIVTTFTAGAQTTLPIFILDNIQRGQQLPIVNAVVFVVIVLTIIPVVIAQRLTHEAGVLSGR